MGWPRLEIVRYDVAQPEIARLAASHPAVLELASAGVPRSAFGRCEATAGLTVIPSHRRVVSGWATERTTRAGGPLVVFATGGGLDMVVALDPVSGEVLSVSDPDGRRGEPTASLMNGSLEHLRSTVQAVIGRFPFYDGPPSEEREEAEARATHDLIRLIEEADPRTAEEPGPWGEFPWDVSLGDFDTASVVGMWPPREADAALP
ncbi:MAG: SUKH-4 family immunity protein [Chloroflexota bacterium]